ncbi:YtzH-like family protein [Fervidibacillus albus]|uniref:YtzH-like family protein n=1 Tax=Fervidibacillus albus TaxID=2980026 RepID=A0A9E8RXZ5_9BACI|nr:YtzH-like family protein [Fervidibacillus albus]WAA10082.1 YtzH-like family protein [Fervidibacillus albus]
MPLHYTDQLQLLKDLLEDHKFDGFGTISEYEQIERLVKSLMANEQVDEQTKFILQEIYRYGQNGKYLRNAAEHVENYQNELTEWVDQIGHFF